MGIFQKAVETYDAMEHLAGVQSAMGEALAPIGYIITTAKIEITIDKEGNFLRATPINEKIPIPCTESSAGRTSAPAAHPLCDRLSYILNIDDKKHSLYLDELKKWSESIFSDDKLRAVYTYVKKDSVMADLNRSELLSIDNSGKIKNLDELVTWRVEGLGDNSGNVQYDRVLQKKYREYYINDNNDYAQCMILGRPLPIARQHIKGISNISGNAKLVSTNDTRNFTFLGRFTDADEAVSISYEASQKAHNALKWLVANQGVSLGDRRMICWNPKGIKVPRVDSPLLIKEDEKATPSNYSEKLESVLYGYRGQLPSSETVVIAAFEAATAGRLSLTYYNELQGSDFLDRLKYWDMTCCWNSSYWGVGSPSLYQILRCAYGIQRGSGENAKMEVDPKIVGKQMQMLISCRIDKRPIPADIVSNIIHNASRLNILTQSNRERILFTGCAVIRKYRTDKYKEVWEMALEENKKDRSYQYGRILAILEKIEKDTYGNDESRETNAIRSQAYFVQRPQAAFAQIMQQLKTGYYPRLSPGARAYYDRIIGEAMTIISEFSDDEIAKPLAETYLMGYYLQKNALYTKREKTTEEEQ